MGGFAGGDEAGYWDVETSISPFKKGEKKKAIIERCGLNYCVKAYAKRVIFKGKDSAASIRWIRSETLFDTICFVPFACERFCVEGCEAENARLIHEAFRALSHSINDPEFEDFFYSHKVVVTKRISSAPELGGNASNIASFILLAKEVCNLILTTSELARIGSSIDPDTPFFIYNYLAADVLNNKEFIEVLQN